MKLSVLMISWCAITRAASLPQSAEKSVASPQTKSLEERLQELFPVVPLGDLRTEPSRRSQPSQQQEASTTADPLFDFEVDLGMPDRIRRSGSNVLSLASSLIGRIAGAAASASAASSGSSGKSYEPIEYGPPVNTYDDKSFDVWAFKKAILNTLFQAFKAIGGGVIALKGQLIKGGGKLVSAKGRLLSAKGDAITALGKHIASSALLSPPKTYEGGYYYDTPHTDIVSHDTEYEGPPPSFSHSGASNSYLNNAPSDDGVRAGLLILKPIESHVEPRRPSAIAIGESYGGSASHSAGTSSESHHYHEEDKFGPSAASQDFSDGELLQSGKGVPASLSIPASISFQPTSLQDFDMTNGYNFFKYPGAHLDEIQLDPTNVHPHYGAGAHYGAARRSATKKGSGSSAAKFRGKQ